MTSVTTTYICVAPEGFQLPDLYGYSIGIASALGLAILFLVFVFRRKTVFMS
jgi:hypothetical protein